MPYIPQRRRDELAAFASPSTAGELNYVISQAVVKYIKRHTLSYQSINDVMGALINSALEFYRRVAVPYEDHKIVDNGDVYQDIIPG